MHVYSYPNWRRPSIITFCIIVRITKTVGLMHFYKIILTMLYYNIVNNNCLSISNIMDNFFRVTIMSQYVAIAYSDGHNLGREIYDTLKAKPTQNKYKYNNVCKLLK